MLKSFSAPLKQTALSLLVLAGCSSSPVAMNSPQTSPTPAQIAALQLKINADENFLLSLAQNPEAVLKAEGIPLPEGEQVQVLTLGEVFYLVLDDRNLTTFHADLLAAAKENPSGLQKQLDAIRAKAERDPAFKAELLADTAFVLQAEGIDPEVAPFFQVIDYRPNTSLLLLPSEGAETSRALNDNEILSYFKNLNGRLVKVFLSSLRKLVLSEMTETDLQRITESMVKAADAECLGFPPKDRGSQFVCTEGQQPRYWMQGLQRLRKDAKKYDLSVMEAALNKVIGELKQIEKSIVLIQAQIKQLTDKDKARALEKQLNILRRDQAKLLSEKTTIEKNMRDYQQK